MKRYSPTTKRLLADMGRNIRTWRLAMGMTAAELAARAGTNRETIGQIEKGATGTSIGIIVSVLHVLGIDSSFVAATDPINNDQGRVLLARHLPERAR